MPHQSNTGHRKTVLLRLGRLDIEAGTFIQTFQKKIRNAITTSQLSTDTAFAPSFWAKDTPISADKAAAIGCTFVSMNSEVPLWLYSDFAVSIAADITISVNGQVKYSDRLESHQSVGGRGEEYNDRALVDNISCALNAATDELCKSMVSALSATLSVP